MDVDAILQWASVHGLKGVGLFSLRRQGNWAAAISSVQASPVSVPYLCHAAMFTLDNPASWDASARAFMDTIDVAKAMGARMVYATTGPAGRLEFDEAVDALSLAIVPVREHAAAQGIKLLTETTNPLMCFTHFLHTFEDTVRVATALDIDVCLDLHPTWHERGIRDKIVAASNKIGLVQVSDHVPRNMTISRDVVGDGIVPIERFLQTIFEAGYNGPVDLELFGRPDETALDDLLRSAEHLTKILHHLGI